MSDEDSTNIQFSRTGIIQAIIETLETRQKYTCEISTLYKLVCRFLEVRPDDPRYELIRNKIKPILLSMLHAKVIKFSGTKKTQYRLTNEYKANLDQLINQYGNDIESSVQPDNSPTSENLSSLPDSLEPSENIPHVEESNITQLTRNDIRRAIVETLESRPNQSCKKSDLDNLVCQHLNILLRGNKRKGLKKKIRQIINALVRANIITAYRVKNQRYRLDADYQPKLNNMLKRRDGNEIYYDSGKSDTQTNANNSSRKEPYIFDNTPESTSSVPDSSFPVETDPIEDDDESELLDQNINLPDLPDSVDPSFYEEAQDEDDEDEQDQEYEDYADSDIDPLDILMDKPRNDPNTDQLLTPTTHISTDDFTFKALRSMIASYIENHPDFESDAVRNKIQMITCMEDVNIFITIAIDRHTSQVTFRAELQNLEVSPEDILNASAEDKFNCIPGCTKSNNHPLIQLRRLIPLLHIDSSRVVEAIDDIVDDSETLIELRRSGS